MSDHPPPGTAPLRPTTDYRAEAAGSAGAGHGRVAALDGLRGLAVVAVIAFHADLLPGGYLGVDLFFVLSGYLITSLLLAEHRARGAIDLAAFWTRRARRLLPALVLVVVVAAAVMLLEGAAARAAFGADAAGALLYVANWRAALGGGGYWAGYAAPSLLEHTWSLAIEEQFYLVWPLVTIAVLRGRRRDHPGDGRRGTRRLLVVALVGAALSASLLIGWSVAGADRDRLYLGTDTRAAGVLLGAALACATVLRSGTSTRERHPVLAAAGWVGAAWLAGAWWLLDGDAELVYRGGLLLCGLAATAVIASVTTVGTGRLARVLAWRPLVAAGLVSYGLYLWHWPIFVWFDESRVGWSGLPLLALQLALTIAAALASYRFVEQPVRRGAFSARPALAAAGAMVLTGALVAVVVAVPADEPDSRTAAASVTPLGPLPGPPGTATPASDAATPPRVLIAGDSVAETVAAGVLPHQTAFGIEARSVAVAGCGVARDNPKVRDGSGREIDETACLGRTAAWADEVESWRPDAVLIVLGWPGQTERFVEGAWRRPCDPAFDRWYAGEVAAAIDAAGASGGHVAITTAPYFRPGSGSTSSDASTDCLNATYRAVAAADPAVAVIDLAAHVCPDGGCTTEREGVALRPDGLHFAGPASVWIADWVLHDQWSAATWVDPAPA